jgi:hypothetical protein
LNHYANPDFWRFFDGMLWGWIGSHAEYDRVVG